MEKYLLYGQFMTLAGGGAVYKGRRKGTVEFYGVQKHPKEMRDLIANHVAIAQGLTHPTIPLLVEWCETPRHVWVVGELVGGGTLGHALQQDGPLPLPSLPPLLRDVGRGLRYLHSVGVVYRDLQPSKIWLDSSHVLKLCDFTLACHAGTMATGHAPVSALLSEARRAMARKDKGRGTSTVEPCPPDAEGNIRCPSLSYTAPEVLLGGGGGGGGGVDPAADLWSLGCLIHVLCTGATPFHGLTPEDLLHAICYESLPPFAHRLSSVNTGHVGSAVSEVVYVVSRLLHKHPKDRLSWKQIFDLPLFSPERRAEPSGVAMHAQLMDCPPQC